MISIISTIYNTGKYIERFLSSIVSQNCNDIEVILVDDGSADNSVKIIKDYIKKYNYIRLYSLEHAGVVAARTFGLKQAKGDYVMILDSDDFLEKKSLKRIKSICESNNPDLVIFHADKYIKGRYIDFLPRFSSDGVLSQEDTIRYKQQVMETKTFNSLWTKCFKRSLIKNPDVFMKWKEVKTGNDLLMSVEVINNAKSFYYLPDILYHYRINPDGIIKKTNFEYYDSLRFVTDELYDLTKYWKCENKELIFDTRRMNDAWLILRSIILSDEDVMSEKFAMYLKTLAKEQPMRKISSNLSKMNLNKTKRFLLWLLYHDKYLMIKIASVILRIKERRI